MSYFLNTEVFPKLRCIQSSEQLTKNEDSWAPTQKSWFSRTAWESIFLTSSSSSSMLKPCRGPDQLFGNRWPWGWWYLFVSYPQVIPPYGQSVFQKNKIEINREMDFLPDFELLRFWKHTVTSDECLTRPGFCSKGTALPSMWHNRSNELDGRLEVRVEGGHLLVCAGRA